MDWKALLADSGLTLTAPPQALSGGTTARVWRLPCAQGAFLLRTLTGPQQGRLEWDIVRALRCQSFDAVPAILPFGDQPAARFGGNWYQLQVFCPGKRPDLSVPGTARRVTALALDLIWALGRCSFPAAMPDRFSLSSTWPTARTRWSAVVPERSPAWAEAQVTRLLTLPTAQSQPIHGDLGLWNLLEDPSGKLWVLDFGEARVDDPYFDLASLLGSLINHAPEALRDRVWDEFCSVFGPDRPLDRPRLLTQFSRWVWRGVSQWLTVPHPDPAMVRRFLTALDWANAHLEEEVPHGI